MKKLYISLAGFILLSLCGCGTPATFKYPPKGAEPVVFTRYPVFDRKVTVTPFTDKRGTKNQMSTLWLYLIPLWPYGPVTYERPEKAHWYVSVDSFHFTPQIELAEAAADSLKKSNLFESVKYAPAPPKNANSLIFGGEIYSTQYHGRLASYGLSWLGPWLWMVGLPSADIRNRLTIKFYLKHPASKKLLWNFIFDDEDSHAVGLFYSYGEDVQAYSGLMQKAMNDAIRDLAASLRQNPNLLNN
jgi:hypothetical protein